MRRGRRPGRRMLRAAALLMAALTGTASCVAATGSAANTAAHAPAAVKPHGASLVGAHVAPTSGQTGREAVQALEKQLGHTVPLVSEYPAWDSAFPTSYYRWLRNSGHRLLLLVKLKRANGSRPSWGALAKAKPGDPLYADMTRWAKGFKSYRAPLYVVFHKEPNERQNRVQGSPADYKAAWARLVTVMRDQGVRNVTWVFAMAGGVFAKQADRWYPGNSVVDVIAATGVNSCTGSNCSYRQQRQIMAPMVTWARHHPDKRIAVAESGTLESTTDHSRKATWIATASGDLKGAAYQGLEFIVYRHYKGYRFDTSRAALAAARDWFGAAYWRS